MKGNRGETRSKRIFFVTKLNTLLKRRSLIRKIMKYSIYMGDNYETKNIY